MAPATQTMTPDQASATQRRGAPRHFRLMPWPGAASHLVSAAGLIGTLIGLGFQDGALQAGGVAALISGSALHLISAARHPQRHQFSAAAEHDR